MLRHEARAFFLIDFPHFSLVSWNGTHRFISFFELLVIQLLVHLEHGSHLFFVNVRIAKEWRGIFNTFHFTISKEHVMFFKLLSEIRKLFFIVKVQIT